MQKLEAIKGEEQKAQESSDEITEANDTMGSQLYQSKFNELR